MLTAGERRSFTANTIFRDPGVAQARPRRRPASLVGRTPTALGLADGDLGPAHHQAGQRRGSLVEVSPMMRPGHISLPNGLGVTETPGDDPVGVAPNELTSSDHRDPIAGTPYHKHVPARLEPISA